MALFSRNLLQNPVKCALTTHTRYFTKNKLPEPIELATGMEKKELLAKMSGNRDPYNMMGRARGVGTKEEPNLIPSAYGSRMIGCICEENSHTVVWMWVHSEEPRRCMCGHWFKLEYKEPFMDYSIPL